MGYHKDMSVQPLDIASINDILRKNRDGNFRPRDFEHIPADAPADAAFEDSGFAPDMEQADLSGGEPETPNEPEVDPALEAEKAAAHKVGYTEGFAEGYQKGLNEAPDPTPQPNPEAEAHLEDTARLFTDLARSLTDHAEEHHTALRKSMEATLLALASDLAGQQIDALPANFASKVEELVERVGKTVDCTQIHLNPDDLAAIEPTIAGSDVIEGCVLQPDEGLPRGAVDIRSGPNRVQSALPDLENEGLPADWDDTELLTEIQPDNQPDIQTAIPTDTQLHGDT